jgi:outer membrane protein assembly factor BamA
MFRIHEGDTIREAIIEEDIQRIIAKYSDAGYPLAKVITESVAPRDSGKLDMTFRIEEGKQPRVVAMNVTGLTSTDTNVVTREFSLERKPLYLPKSIDAARNRVSRLGIFSSVGEPQLIKYNDSSLGLSLAVSEGNTTFIDGIIGYGPAPGIDEKPIISGFLTLDFRNIGGTARAASFRFRREDPSKQQLDLYYKEPWFLNYPISLEASFGTRDEDTVFSRINTSLSAGIFLNDITTITGLVGYESVTPGSAKVVYATTALRTGLYIDIDTRNDIYAPTSGFQVKLDGIFNAKSVSGSTVYDSLGEVSTSVTQVNLLATGYIPTFTDKWILVAKLNGANINGGSGKLQQNDLYRIGGLRTLRGYYESQFTASLALIGTLEYRLMFSKASFFSLFSDIGYLEREDGIGFDATKEYPVSYGFGISFGTKIGVFQASIALPKGEQIDNAKLHFGLTADL